MDKKIAVLTYDAPHRKTYDVLAYLSAAGEKVTIFALPFESKKNHKPLYQHRPTISFIYEPEAVYKNWGHDYKKATIESLFYDLKGFEYILLAGAPILPKKVVEAYKIINSHPGYLPDVRGLDALKWAIVEDQLIGVTTYFISEEADTGNLLERNQLHVQKNDTFYCFAQKLYEMEINMLGRSVHIIEGGAGLGMKLDDINVLHKRMPHSIEKDLLKYFDIRRLNVTGWHNEFMGLVDG